MTGGWGHVLASPAARAALAKLPAHRNAHGLLPRVPEAPAAASKAKPKGRRKHSALCGRNAGAPCDCGLDAKRRELEDLLARQLAEDGVQGLRRDPFTLGCVPGRDFRPDFTHDASRLVVEVQGNAGGGRGPHGGFDKLSRDVEKVALLAAFGWRVLPCTGAMIRSGVARRLVLAAIAWRPAT